MKYRIVFKIALLTVLHFSCGTISAQNKMNAQEKYIDKMVATYKNEGSYCHISVLGCNLGNSYAVFSENLKKKGYKLVSTSYDYWEGLGHDRCLSWKGKMSDRNVRLQLDCCGKYIVRIWMEIDCKNKEDESITYRNVLGSLNQKYGHYSRKDIANRYWDKANARIQLCSTIQNVVCITYDDLIYQNWIKEYDKAIKTKKIEQERKVFDNNL